MNKDEVIAIKKSDLVGLVKDSMLYQALAGGGVDNWVGYADALYEDYGYGAVGKEVKRADFYEVYCKAYEVPGPFRVRTVAEWQNEIKELDNE